MNNSAFTFRKLQWVMQPWRNRNSGLLCSSFDRFNAWRNNSNRWTWIRATQYDYMHDVVWFGCWSNCSASRFFVSTIEIQAMSTHRAGGMGDKPFINAFHVEAMIALWQNSHLLSFSKFGQANRTVRRHGPWLWGSAVNDNGQCSHGRLIQSSVAHPIGWVEHDPHPAMEQPSEKRVENDREDENTQQSQDSENDQSIGIDSGLVNGRTRLWTTRCRGGTQ